MRFHRQSPTKKSIHILLLLCQNGKVPWFPFAPVCVTHVLLRTYIHQTFVTSRSDAFLWLSLSQAEVATKKYVCIKIELIEAPSSKELESAMQKYRLLNNDDDNRLRSSSSSSSSIAPLPSRIPETKEWGWNCEGFSFAVVAAAASAAAPRKPISLPTLYTLEGGGRLLRSERGTLYYYYY